MKIAGWFLLGIFATACILSSQAQALPKFRDAFKKKYVDPSNSDDFKKAFGDGSATCLVCHVQGKPKKVRNDYGKALDKFIAPNGGKKISADDLDKALDDVAKEPSAIEGKSFGDLIKDGKLPNSKPDSK